MTRKTLPLTPLEQARAEEQAYKGWLEKRKIYHPPPEPDTTDLVHESPWVVRAMTGAVAFLPVLLAVIGVAAIAISSDKTMFAFHAAVANKDALWGAWSVFVAGMAVVLVEGGLCFAEFGAVRDNLRKGLHRRVWNVADLWHSIQVRLGRKQPLDYNEMPDGSLRAYSRFMFALVLMANTYGVLHAYTGDGKSLATLEGTQYLELVLFLFVGIAGAISLRLIGAQLAHMVYDLMDQRRRDEAARLRERWRNDLMDLWAQEGDRIVAQALHTKFCQKNKLPEGSGSPYLLLAGENEEGEPSVQALPLPVSWKPSPGPSRTGSPNGDQETM